jgi:protein TonB
MTPPAWRRVRDAYGRTFEVALAASLALCLLAFAVMPPLGIERVEVATTEPPTMYDVPDWKEPEPPREIPRPKVLNEVLDEDVEEVEELPDSVFDPADSAPAPPPPPRRGGSFLVFEDPPRVRSAPAPDYPSIARAAGIEGTVRLLVTVGLRGRVERVEVLDAEAEVLVMPAVEAVRRWRFEPARQSGQPVRATILVPVRFALD